MPKRVDLTGKKYGQLTALEYAGRVDSPGDYKRIWKYQCDCGNITYARVSDLTQGCTVSCGCVSSSTGEVLVSSILNQLNVLFEREYTFDDCRDKLLLPFDFYLPEYNILIEYNGKQHYEPIDFFGGELEFKIRLKHDNIKKQYCLLHNIQLLIIPYTYSVEEVKQSILNVMRPVTITAS